MKKNAWFLNPLKKVVFLKEYTCSTPPYEKFKKGEKLLLHCSSDNEAFLVLGHGDPIEVLSIGIDVEIYEPSKIKRGFYILKKKSMMLKNLFEEYWRSR